MSYQVIYGDLYEGDVNLTATFQGTATVLSVALSETPSGNMTAHLSGTATVTTATVAVASLQVTAVELAAVYSFSDITYLTATLEGSATVGTEYRAVVALTPVGFVESSKSPTVGFALYGGSGIQEALAQRFAEHGRLDRLQLRFFKFGSPVDNVYVKITTVLGGSPVATSNLVACSTLGGWATFTFDTKPTLAVDTVYFLELYRDGTRDETNFPYWIFGDALYGAGFMLVNDSSVWTDYPPYDYHFRLFFVPGGPRGGTNLTTELTLLSDTVSALLTGTAQLAATPDMIVRLPSPILGTATLTTTLQSLSPISYLAANLTGSATFAAAVVYPAIRVTAIELAANYGTTTLNLQAALQGDGTVGVVLTVPHNLPAVLSGTGTVTTELTVIEQLTGGFIGTGTVDATLSILVNMTIDGTATLTTLLTVVEELTATLTGSATVETHAETLQPIMFVPLLLGQ